MDDTLVLSIEFKSWLDNSVNHFRLFDDGTNWIVHFGDLDDPDEILIKEKAPLTSSIMDDIVLVLYEFQDTNPEIFRVSSYSTLKVVDYCEDLFSILNFFEYQDVEDEIYDADYRPYWSEYGKIVDEFKGSDKFKIIVQDEYWVAVHGLLGCMVAPASELRLAIEKPIATWNIETDTAAFASNLICLDFDETSYFISLDMAGGEWPSTHVHASGSRWMFSWEEATSSDWRTIHARNVYEWLKGSLGRWEEDQWDVDTLKKIDLLRELRSMSDLQSIMVRKSQVYSVSKEWGEGFEDQSLNFSIRIPGLNQKQREVLKVLSNFSPQQLWEFEGKIESMSITGQRFEEAGEFQHADIIYSRNADTLSWEGNVVSSSGAFTYYPFSVDLYSIWTTSDCWTIEIKMKPDYSAKDLPMPLLELMSKLDKNSYISRAISVNGELIVEL